MGALAERSAPVTSYPLPAQLNATIPARTRSDAVTAECKRIIEERWRSVGVQIHVTIEDGVIRSDLKDGWPPQ